jgi:hypothetical protein
MNWLDYEDEIFKFFRATFPEAEIRRNVSVEGRYSKVLRQIDILIEDYVAGVRFRTAVDGKFFSSNVDVKEVECFIGMLDDIEAHKGILITQVGYSQAAIKRAHYDQHDIDLDILNYEDLKDLQGEGAIPYSGNNGVLMPAPLGWVIDGKRRQGCVATLYQRGLTLEEAGKHKEWMYINFSQKTSETKTAEEVAELQDKGIREDFPDAKITYLPTIKRKDARTLLRRIDISTYPTPEYTGFVEFDDFVFFAVLFTPVELAKRNIRKLEYIMAKVLPLGVRHSTADDKTSDKSVPPNTK